MHLVALDSETAMSRESAKPSLFRPRIWTIIVMMVVAAPIVVANLNHDERPPVDKAWPPPNPAYGWPLIWYWCEFKSTFTVPNGGAPTRMHPELMEWSGHRLAGNVVIWLAILGVVGFAFQWLLRRYRPRRMHRPRVLTFIVLLVVTALTVLANLSGDDTRWPLPAPRYGWPLTWRWRDWQMWYGASTELDYNFSVVRLIANLAMWLVMLTVSGVLCEWLLHRYQPRLRWSLRTMLAAVALVALLCGWGVALRERARAQDPVIDFAGGPFSASPLQLYVERGPQWLALLGADRFCRRVVGADVELRSSNESCEEILKRLAEVPDLRYVKIEIRNATGMAAALPQMRQLRTLRINGDSYSSHNVVSQECLEAVGKLTQLEDLHLRGTSDGGDLACLAGLTNLKSLSLQIGWESDQQEPDGAENNARASFFAGLPPLPRLERLDIRSWGDSMVGDQDLRHLAILPRLKSLNLSDSDITDEGLAELASLDSLEELAIGHDMVTPAGLRSLLALKRLKTLHVKRYAIVTREVLAALPFQKSLKHLENSEEGLSEAESSVVDVLELLNELHGEGDGSEHPSNRLTTVELGHGERILALESEVDDFRHALEALRQAQPGIVIDSDPKWFDQKRGEKTEELFWPPRQGGGMF